MGIRKMWIAQIVTVVPVMLVASVQAAPAFPEYNQGCRDDAGPPWVDDVRPYHTGSAAEPILKNQSCPEPLKGACEQRADVKTAFLEGPLNCGGNGWFCRILEDRTWPALALPSDRNFGYCNQSETDQSGHCHGSDDESTYYWWVRDHWFRQYNGRLRCCCGWNNLQQGRLVNRCDYRRLVLPGTADSCRDANEDHNLGFEGGCDEGVRDDQLGKIIPEDESQCWEVHRFGFSESDGDEGEDASDGDEDENEEEEEEEEDGSDEDEENETDEDGDEEEDDEQDDEIHYGDCVLKHPCTSPDCRRDNPFFVSRINRKYRQGEFRKAQNVFGLKLIGQRTSTDRTFCWVSRTLTELLGSTVPRQDLQHELVDHLYQRKVTVPIIRRNRNNFNLPDRVHDTSSICDIIEVFHSGNRQVSEVLEHLLHFLFIGLGFTFPDDWGLTGNITNTNGWDALQEAVAEGIYDISDYDVASEKRIILQEFHWFITGAALGLFEAGEFNLDRDTEWNGVNSLEEMQEKLPKAYALHMRTTNLVIASPRLSTLRKLRRIRRARCRFPKTRT